MIFITLSRVKATPTKEAIDQVTKIDSAFAQVMEKLGIKVLGNYWTLGRFDDVLIFEAPNEKVAMKFAVEVGKLGFSTTETMVAIPREEGIKLF